jgi:hypothetical protein
MNKTKQIYLVESPANFELFTQTEHNFVSNKIAFNKFVLIQLVNNNAIVWFKAEKILTSYVLMPIRSEFSPIMISKLIRQ